MEPIPSYVVDAFRPDAPGETRSVPMQLLAAQPMFRDLSHADLMTVAQMLRPLSYDAGAFIFKQGTEPDGLYLLEAGEVLMWTRMFDSRRDIVRFQAGAPLCAASLVETGGRVASMEALKPSKVWVLEQSDFASLREKGHPIAFRLLHCTAMEMAGSFTQVCGHFRAAVGFASTGDAAPAQPLPDGRPVMASDLPLLKVLPFARALPPEELDALAQLGLWRELPRGHRLFAEGGPAGDLHLVVRGAIEAIAESGEKRLRLSLRGPGRWVGNDAFCSGGSQPYSAVVKEAASVLGFTRADFDRLYAGGQRVALRLLEQISASFANQFNGDLPALMRNPALSASQFPVPNIGPDGMPVKEAAS
jgi:CRP-like cAMP-binding protein